MYVIIIKHAVQFKFLTAFDHFASFQGAAEGGRQKGFDHFFHFRDSFGHSPVTFSDASVTFCHFLPNSFCRTPFVAGRSFLLFLDRFPCLLLTFHWETDFYPVRVLGAIVLALRGCQTPAQYWIKIVHPWVPKFYPVLGLGSGERLLWHIQTPGLYWINFSLRFHGHPFSHFFALFTCCHLAAAISIPLMKDQQVQLQVYHALRNCYISYKHSVLTKLGLL